MPYDGPGRKELERQLLSALQKAQLDWKLAAAQFKQLFEQGKDMGLPHPDGHFVVKQAAALEKVTLTKYHQAVKEFSDLVLHGKRP